MATKTPHSFNNGLVRSRDAQVVHAGDGRSAYQSPKIKETVALKELVSRGAYGKEWVSIEPHVSRPGYPRLTKDLTNIKCGSFMPLYRVKNLLPKGTLSRFAIWFCRCDCGAYSLVRACSLVKTRGKRGACRICRNFVRPYEITYNILRKHAARGGRECMTYEEFMPFTAVPNCHYCAEPLTWAKYDYRRQGRAINLDRKDNRRGYSADNVVPCCWTCNATKSDKLTYEEMVAVGQIRRKSGLVPFTAPRGMRIPINGHKNPQNV